MAAKEFKEVKYSCDFEVEGASEEEMAGIPPAPLGLSCAAPQPRLIKLRLGIALIAADLLMRISQTGH